MQSSADPNLYNGNPSLDLLNEKLFGKGSKDCKLTLKGIKESAKQFADNNINLVSEIANLIITKTGENMKTEKNQPVLVEDVPNTAPQTTSFLECLINLFACCRG